MIVLRRCTFPKKFSTDIILHGIAQYGTYENRDAQRQNTVACEINGDRSDDMRSSIGWKIHTTTHNVWHASHTCSSLRRLGKTAAALGGTGVLRK